MLIYFTKMHGLGNDFMVIDAVTQKISLSTEQIQALADRHFGVGFDQLLLLEPPLEPHADFFYRIYNADGSEVEQCGNGARCVTLFAYWHKLTGKKDLILQTLNGQIETHRLDNDQVRVNMGVPIFNPKEIPFLAPKKANMYDLKVGGETYSVSALSMGNPHAILKVEDVERAPVKKLGALIEQHPDFPQRVNVSFMQVVGRHNIKLRVFERGVGETQACGTGACASAAAAINNGWADSEVKVMLKGGDLLIQWKGENQPLLMTGPATRVFEGKIKL